MPTKEDILAFIERCPTVPDKNEIARAFHLRGEQRIPLKQMLRELKQAGLYGPKRATHASLPRKLPEYCVVRATRIDEHGDLYGIPVTWEYAEDAPEILLDTSREFPVSPAVGDQVVVKLLIRKHGLEGRVLRILAAQKERLLGILTRMGKDVFLEPVNRRDKHSYLISNPDEMRFDNGDLALVEQVPITAAQRRFTGLGSPLARIVEVMGPLTAPRAFSMIAIYQHGIPTEFPPEAIAQAEMAEAPELLPGREDLRSYALVTIDGEDARDFDDAVWAEPDNDPANPRGWHLLVAIADVSHYVKPGSALDEEARNRGNSVYFPDRVVPMLPEALSNGLCSLNPKEDRYCLAVHLWITEDGKLLRHRFVRGVMNSRVRFTYTRLQRIYDGERQEGDEELFQTIIKPLYGVYHSLLKRRIERGALELDMEEYYIRIDEAGKVAEVHPRERLDSHKLIEECMIAANVAAAISLQDAVSHAMYRAHEPPTVEKINEIRYFLDRMGYSLSKGDGVQGHHFNRILKEVAEKPERQIVNMAVLRSQTQAYYYPTNRGHFGLALDHYCHFTSPIRRYSDLIVHRLLISSLNLGEDSREYHTPERLAEVADHISQTERRAMLAERDARERYIAAFMADKVGVYFEGTVSSANSFGLFVTVTGTGASGLVPVRSLGDDFYHYDKERNELIGRRYGQIFRAGQRVSVELLEANPATGSLLFGLLSAEEIRTPGGRSQLTGNRYERRATESRVRKDSRGRPEREERSPRHRGKASASRKGKSGSPSGGGGKGKPKRKGR